MTISRDYICEWEAWELLLDFVAGNPGSREALEEYAQRFEDEAPAQIIALREALAKPSARQEPSVSRSQKSALVRFLATALSAGAGHIVFENDLKLGREEVVVLAHTPFEKKDVAAIVSALLGLNVSTVEKIRPRNNSTMGRTKLVKFGAAELRRVHGPAEDLELRQRVAKYIEKHLGPIVLPCSYELLLESHFFEHLTDPDFL